MIGTKNRFSALEETIVNLNEVDAIILGITKKIRKI
jgi:hypothetical protein